jgi:hypothetical protein
MPVDTVRCSKCGKPLENIPAYLAEGAGAQLFQCDSCFYPDCEKPSRLPVREAGERGGRIENIVEDWALVKETAGAAK